MQNNADYNLKKKQNASKKLKLVTHWLKLNVKVNKEAKGELKLKEIKIKGFWQIGSLKQQ